VKRQKERRKKSMDNIITLSSYKELREAIELHKEVHGLILDSMIRRQSLIDSGEDVPELPKELQELFRF
jgi:hypothetical protein